MGPVRMISSGHELTTDYDEKTLHELGFKDMQVTRHSGLQKTYSRFQLTQSHVMFVCPSADGVRLSGSPTEGEEGGRRPAAGLLSASPSEGAHPHAAAPPGATPHHAVRPAGDAGLFQTSQSKHREAPGEPRGHSPLHLLNLVLFQLVNLCVFNPECTLRGASPPRRESVPSGLGAAHAASYVSQDAAGLPEHLRRDG